MKRTFESLLAEKGYPEGKMVFMVGPRQVGKTTLARQILERRHCDNFYHTWDDLIFRRAVSKDPYGFIDAYRPSIHAKKPLIVLDEIHKFPRWKSYLKGLWDTRNHLIDILVTGSGRLDIYQRGGDSLIGRYRLYRLHPLSVKEVIEPESVASDYGPEVTLNSLISADGRPPKKVITAFNALLKWGGFPAPFIKRDDRYLRLWHSEKKRLIVREDLRDLTHIQLLSHVEELIELLSVRAASILSFNSLREDLQVALDSVRLWVDALTRLYYMYLIRPYSGRIARSLTRAPKVYLWDWSEIEDKGRRFENMIANHLLKWCHFCQDMGYEPLELYYVRDKEKREVDFLITKKRKPWFLIETKISIPDTCSALNYFSDKLGVKYKFLVVAGIEQPGKIRDVCVLDAPTFCACLPV